mgnify:CR=1 FL=1
MNPVGEGIKIWVIHQAASRWIRKDIATCMKKGIKEMDAVDLDDLIEHIENEYNRIEDNFVKMYSDNVPTFDFEIN